MVKFLQAFFPWLLYLAAIIAAIHVHLVYDTPFWHALLFSVIILNGGVEALWLAMGDLFYPEATAKSIGWEPCGFQTEAGGANLGIGITSFLCFFEPNWIIPVSLILVIFYSACAYAHVKDRIIRQNKAILNSGPMLYNTFVVILTVCLCLMKLSGLL